MDSLDATQAITPESCKVHQSDYKPQAWEAYSFSELGDFVHLLAKRATHRADAAKRKKDLYDARNYLAMMDAKLAVMEDEYAYAQWMMSLMSRFKDHPKAREAICEAAKLVEQQATFPGVNASDE